MKNLIEILQEIRLSPRKQHKSYLESIGVLDMINHHVPTDYKIKEKIDIIIKGTYDKCFCGSLCKPESNWCSITCRNKDPLIRESIGKKNSENKVSRSIALKKTLNEKYNVSAVQDIPSVKEKTKIAKQSYYDGVIQNTFKKYNVDIIKFSDFCYLDSITKNGSYTELSKYFFNKMPPMTIYRHFDRINYDPKFPKSSSIGQREVQSFLFGLGIHFITEDRILIKPFEIDIFLPKFNLGIEFNGLYFHDSTKKSKEYHKMKTDLCKEKNISLIHVFDDEWTFKQEIIKSIIKSKLGLLDKIFARKTELKLVSGSIAKEFYENNHIQGWATSTFHYGLYFNNELTSLMSVGKIRNKLKSNPNNMLELVRFCNKLGYSVVGGFSKLLKYAKTELNCPILTFADLRFFDGRTYDKFGKYSHTTEIGYYWVNPAKTKKYSRYMTQKHKLSKFLGNNFNASLTEEENMINNGYTKIYDCGNIAYIL